jgi:hypothetical protein
MKPQELLRAQAETYAPKRAAIAVGILFERQLDDREREAIAWQVAEVLKTAQSTGTLLPKDMALPAPESIRAISMDMEENINVLGIAC